MTLGTRRRLWQSVQYGMLILKFLHRCDADPPSEAGMNTDLGGPQWATQSFNNGPSTAMGTATWMENNKAQGVSCVVDIGQATVSLAEAGNFIYQTTLACKNMGLGLTRRSKRKKASCAVQISNVVASVLYVAAYGSMAASECGQTINYQAMCSGDINGLLNGFATAASVGAGLWAGDCSGLGMRFGQKKTAGVRRLRGVGNESSALLSQLEQFRQLADLSPEDMAEVAMGAIEASIDTDSVSIEHNETDVAVARRLTAEIRSFADERIDSLIEEKLEKKFATEDIIMDLARNQDKEFRSIVVNYWKHIKENAGNISGEGDLEQGPDSRELVKIPGLLHLARTRKRIDGQRASQIAFCVTDVFQAMFFLIRAALAITGSVISCPKQTSDDQAACAVNIGGVIGSFAYAVLYFANIATHCPIKAPKGAGCAADIAGIITAFGSVVSSGADFVLSCEKKEDPDPTEIVGRRLVGPEMSRANQSTVV